MSNQDLKNSKHVLKLVKYEAGILNYLTGVKGVPKYYEYKEEDGVQIMSMEYLGKDLDVV